jgi:hypothetical protein
MSLDVAIRQLPPKEPSVRSAPLGSGTDVVGSVSGAGAPEVGPPSPRLRIDRDLGMVVIEFRDAAGRITASLPTNREIEAYRASILFGADLPSDVKSLRVEGDGPSAARPGIPAPPPQENTYEAQSSSAARAQSASLNKVA